MTPHSGPARLVSLAMVVVVAAVAGACSAGDDRAWRSSVAAAAGGPTGDGLTVSVAPSSVVGPLGGGATIVVTVADLPGPARSQVFIDADGDRETGMWTFQSPLSASGWDLLVDGDGKLYRHDGPPSRWTWRLMERSTYQHTVLGNRREIVLPAPLLGGSPGRVRVAAEVGGNWYPAAFLPGVAMMPDAAGSSVRRTGPPGSLAIFYGRSPWLVRDCQPSEPVACAAGAFAAFDHVVLGSGLEEPAHPSHASAHALVSELRALAPSTEVWGYVSLIGGPSVEGTRPVVHSIEDIASRAAAWKALGATGIFLDEADLCRPAFDDCPRDRSGREVEVTRARQTAAATAIHRLDMPVFVNGFAVPHVLGEVGGLPSPFGGPRDGRPADVYLLENLNVSAGQPASGFDVQVRHARLELALRLGAATGIRLAAVDTLGDAAPDLASAPRFYREGLALASQAGLDAYGFTNSSYSSETPVSMNLALPPRVPAPAVGR